MDGGLRGWIVTVVGKTAEEWRRRPAPSESGGGGYSLGGASGGGKIGVVGKGGEGGRNGRRADGQWQGRQRLREVIEGGIRRKKKVTGEGGGDLSDREEDRGSSLLMRRRHEDGGSINGHGRQEVQEEDKVSRGCVCERELFDNLHERGLLF